MAIPLLIFNSDGQKSYKDCPLGWVDFELFSIFNNSTAKICYIPSKTTENRKKNLDPVTASSLVMTFRVMHYISVKHFYSHYGLLGYQNFM
jgi:hypothetical protein